ncbi:MAG: VIT1/CCC1 transporter family protein [Candidatus Saccharimonadales bacterium]
MAKDESTTDEKLSVSKLNWLRAAVLGVNDGLVSVSSIVLGVGGAGVSRGTIFTAGLAGLVAGALSMAVGEYVSVSSQRDSERAYIAKEKISLRDHSEAELKELGAIYEAKGLSPKTAHQVAKELTAQDPIKTHLDAELNLDEEDLNNPAQAAVASLISFSIGGFIPLIVVLASGESIRLVVTFLAVLAALVITGYVSATIGRASRKRAVIRVVVGGAVAMIVTYGIGALFGTAVG